MHPLAPLSLALVLASSLPCQSGRLVSDVETRAAGVATARSLQDFTSTGTRLYYKAFVDDRSDLFVLDAGFRARVLRGPGDASLDPQSITPLGPLAIFTAYDPDHGREIWTTLGVPSTTKLLIDFTPGRASSYVRSMVKIGQEVWFAASKSPTAQLEIWRTDGSSAGTRRVHVFPRTSIIEKMTAGPGGAWIAVRTPAGMEMWRSDGTPRGTVLVRSFLQSQGQRLGPATEYKGKLFFIIQSSINDELWSSDGTSTTRFATLGPVSKTGLRPLAVAGGRLWFTRYTSANGHELVRSDGTSQTTLDLVPGKQSSDPQDFVSIGTRLWFTASTATHGREPWSSDGSLAGTKMVSDFNPGAHDSDSDGFVDVGGKAAFCASTASGRPLWLSDGTATGSRIVAPRANRGLHVLNATWLLFLVGSRTDAKLYRCLGNLTSPKLVPTTVTKSGTESAYPTQFVRLGDRVLFEAKTSAHGSELWTTDGSQRGTRLLADIRPGPEGSHPRHLTRDLTRVGDRVFFHADDGKTGNELWCTDGTTSGTRLVLDINRGRYGSSPREFVGVGKHVFFLGNWGVYCSDGTVQGTRFLGISSARSLARYGDAVYSVNRSVLESMDASGTRRTIGSDPGLASTTSLGVAGDKLVVLSSEGVYFYDGNKMSKFVSRLSSPREFVESDGYGYFVAGSFLMMTDGTVAGTRVLWAGAPPRNLIPMERGIYFYGRDSAHGNELWYADPAGARMAFDHVPGTEPGLAPVARLGRRVLCVETLSRQLWISDGTAQGSTRLRSAAGGALQSWPYSLPTTLFRGEYLLGARGSNAGYELWGLDVGASVESIGRGCSSPKFRSPRLASNDPQLGATWRLTGSNFTKNGIIACLFAAPAATPIGTCELHLDLATLGVTFARASTATSWQWSTKLPTTTSLQGIRLGMQAIQASSDTALGFDLSNGLSLVLGN